MGALAVAPSDATEQIAAALALTVTGLRHQDRYALAGTTTNPSWEKC